MNPTAIYSKSGKGVQEAAGKTSLLKRPDRAVLAAIDGRATLADVAQKVGKPFDAGFKSIIAQLDRAGFIREVSAGTAVAAPAPRPAAVPKAPAKAKVAAPSDPASDLDFSMLGRASVPSMPPRDQESALFKARQEAEAKAKAERERVKAETQRLMRAEIEAKAKAQAEEAKRAREEAERIRKQAEADAARLRKEAQEKAERARKEAEEKARREAEELRQRLEAERKEAERKAREEAERKAREEAERIRREAEEEARKAREEAERIRREAEEQARKAREEAERARREAEAQARKAREEAERREREEAERRAREEAERKARDEADRNAREEAERKAREEAEASLPEVVMPPAPPEPEPEPLPEAKLEGFSDSLMADLESFTTREEQQARERAEAQRAKEEAQRKAREEAERRAREQAERQAAEEAKRRRREEKERRRREEEERLAREEEERKARFRAEEEQREREAQERRRKAMEEEALARKAVSATPVESHDSVELRRRAQAMARDTSIARAGRRRRPRWGLRIMLTLAVLAAGALGAAHFVSLPTIDYERAAAEALGRPVRIASARLWLPGGLQLRLEGVSVGDIRIARLGAYPKLLSLAGDRKAFSRIEVERLQLPQHALGEALFGDLRSGRFAVDRIVVHRLELPGAVPLPADLEAEATLDAAGAVRTVTVRGPEGLLARIMPKGRSAEIDVHAASFTLPFAPEISLSQFAMKGTATAQGLQIAEWDGATLNGTLSGTARVRWGRSWNVDGVVTARGINAAVFAPALLSEGRAEGTGKFSMSGADPAKLGALGRLEGTFSINKGVLGSFDLSRAIQTDGKNPQGRTQFAEMTGYAVYDQGRVSLRNVMIGAGALNAGASADIAQDGALSGRIVADVRTAAETLRATLTLGGTLKEPQVRD